MTSRTAFVSRSRQVGQSLAEGRRSWVVWLAVAKAQGHLASRERWPLEGDALSFANLTTRLTAPFPLRRACAFEAAAGALRIARGLAIATDAADRAELGELLLRTVRFLDRLLYEHAHDAAELSRRIAGDGGD